MGGEFVTLLPGLPLTGWVKSDKSTSKQAVCERYEVVGEVFGGSRATLRVVLIREEIWSEI